MSHICYIIKACKFYFLCSSQISISLHHFYLRQNYFWTFLNIQMDFWVELYPCSQAFPLQLLLHLANRLLKKNLNISFPMPSTSHTHTSLKLCSHCLWSSDTDKTKPSFTSPDSPASYTRLSMLSVPARHVPSYTSYIPYSHYSSFNPCHLLCLKKCSLPS